MLPGAVDVTVVAPESVRPVRVSLAPPVVAAPGVEGWLTRAGAVKLAAGLERVAERLDGGGPLYLDTGGVGRVAVRLTPSGARALARRLRRAAGRRSRREAS